MKHSKTNTAKSKSRIGAALGILVASSTPSLAHADAKSMEYSFVDARNYWALIRGMHDIDQTRATVKTSFGVTLTQGVDGDGRYHCGPTSAANLLGFIAEHGYPEAASNADKWTPPSPGASSVERFEYRFTYNSVSHLINDLGREMGTDWPPGIVDGDGATGTSLNSIQDALESRLPEFNLGIISDRDCDADDEVNSFSISMNIAMGNLMILNIGRYSPDADGKLTRTSGHIVVPVGALKAGSYDQIYIHDPAIQHCPSGYDCNSTTQSKYQADRWELRKVRHAFAEEGCSRSVYEVAHLTSSTTITLIERLLVVSPPRPFTGSEPIDLSFPL